MSRRCGETSSRGSRRRSARAPVLSRFDPLATAGRQAAALAETAHRPWALPDAPWALGQTLEDQLFAHWRVPAEELRGRLPAALQVDTYEEEAWLGVTAFRVTGSRLRGLLPVPLLSSFLQLNVRTYVNHAGVPGIWFFSIDVSSAFAQTVGRRLFDLPLHHARITSIRSGERIDLALTRRHQPETPVAFGAGYEPLGPATRPHANSLEHFLTERYRLYAQIKGRLHYAELHHRPWKLQRAHTEIQMNTITPPDLALSDDVLCHFSRQLDTLLWPLEPVAT